jgi:hypothetical protein
VARAFDLEKYAFAAGINFAKESLGWSINSTLLQVEYF